MKAASGAEIRKELKTRSAGELVEICMRLSRLRLENKEMLSYILFEADDEPSFIRSVKDQMTQEISAMNSTSIYLAKKTIRKVLRTARKFIRYSGSRVAEVEILVHYCTLLKESGIPLHKSNAVMNIYINTLRKIRNVVSVMHEDLQHDYLKEIEKLDLR